MSRTQTDHTGLHSIIDSGMLDRSISFYSPSVARSTTGQATITYNSVGTDMAIRMDGPPNETEKNFQETSEAFVFFTIRYRTDIAIDPSWRILDDSIYYDVVGKQEVPRRQFWIIKTLYIEPR